MISYGQKMKRAKASESASALAAIDEEAGHCLEDEPMVGSVQRWWRMAYCRPSMPERVGRWR